MPAPSQFRVHHNKRDKCWTLIKGKITLEHPISYCLFECAFVILRVMQARAIKTGVRTVHALVEGTPGPLLVNPVDFVQIDYNTKVGYFHVKTDPTVKLLTARIVRFCPDGTCWALL